MAFWDKILDLTGTGKTGAKKVVRPNADPSNWAIIDIEVGVKDKRIHDIGAIRHDSAKYHGLQKPQLSKFLENVDFVCGHNIVNHDATYIWEKGKCNHVLVDTLYVSPLLFSERPYHRLLKDDKLLTEQINNPVNDCEKAKELLFEEIAKWNSLPISKRQIFASLLGEIAEFEGFIRIVGTKPDNNQLLPELIKETYHGQICSNADISSLISTHPCELAYALALIDTNDYRSITPGWVLHNFPNVEYVVQILRQNRCAEGCEYCNRSLDVRYNLKQFFGYDNFRTYNGEPLQERAAEAAVIGKSLLAIFPTGGGKSLTFQLPAMMAGQALHGLTVVISPLQSLMKDQVDNLADKGITDAVTINGLLDPISRSLAIQRVKDGDASLLYIAPEMLRSKTIEHILLARNVVRFVIDEAHCFSSWGQDFRVDYLYIGKFISQYQQKKKCKNSIPVSCFTATAKQKVIQDICDYFKQTIGVNLKLFASTASRTNLQYSVIHADTDDDKYSKLRSLVSEFNCSTIIYVSRTKRTKELAAKLTRDGYKALPFNGKMDSDEKIANQEAFMSDNVRIIVATSAFGMGVDKSDVGLVIHYDISDSLENYVQEAGRAGRDPQLNARCYVLYSDSDLDKHFILLNQTKLSLSEIQQVWKAIKDLTKQRPKVCCSALEIARQAGWDDSVTDIETRVRTAISALEQSGYVERGTNVPHVYATGITVQNMDEARKRIMESLLFESQEVEKAVRIIKSLISEKHISKAQDVEAESRVDYLADILGMKKGEVISVVERMRQEGILADSKDITAYILDGENEKKSKSLLERFIRLEEFILKQFSSDVYKISCRQLNDNAVKDGISTATEKDIRTLLYFLSIKGYMRKKEDSARNLELTRQHDHETTVTRFEKRIGICQCIVEKMYDYATQMTEEEKEKKAIQFSVVALLNDVKSMLETSVFDSNLDVQIEDIEEALLYLSKIGALKLEGGFLVLYNAMEIRRVRANTFKFGKENYNMLDAFYQQKIQQIHIVGEYANLMVRDYAAALTYVQDYFQIDYKRFIAKYFKGERVKEIQRNLTPQKFDQIYSKLSERQMSIISDKTSRVIVVAAGPGSGKTMVLVHKLASLLQLEDVKHEQLLMLTFSRAAATEFKQRLMKLIGNAAHFVEIKTFHSYCFDLLGLMGNLEDARDVVARAAKMIEAGEVEQNKIGKTVLVIDEAQDMSEDEHALVKALIHNNEEMRIIAVGDDDQNIYEFRGSDSKYMGLLARMQGSRFIEMTENYRSSKNVVSVANQFVKSIPHRLKHTAVIAKSQEDGYVQVTHHASQSMYLPLLYSILRNTTNGSRCVLTQTNEEAVIMVALLRKNGLKAKLIQSMESFRFWNLAEMRFFLKQIEKGAHNSTIIPDQVWQNAKEKTNKTYAESTCLQYVQRCIKLFETISKAKYITDFKEFVFESSVENFCDVTDADVVVSTIHKAKGKEFDDVYMMLTDVYHPDEKTLRRYYVGITRAKKRLFIHTNGSMFDNIEDAQHFADSNQYDLPNEVALQLSHKDVNLGFFKDKKSIILKLRGGSGLEYRDYALYHINGTSPIVKLSAKMRETIDSWENRGYVVTAAAVRFVVAWKPQDAPKEESETAVLLPDLTLTKKKSDNPNKPSPNEPF